MLSKHLYNKGRFLSLILRHNPGKAGIELDDGGWADILDICKALNISFDQLAEIVASNDKKRFAFNNGLTKIRASQGHSIPVNLGLSTQQPPKVLYHGTVQPAVIAILNQGIDKVSRTHVHLSQDFDTAVKVAKRRGAPFVLHIRAKDMYDDGFSFYLSENKVWLTDHVPSLYISRVDRNIGE